MSVSNRVPTNPLLKATDAQAAKLLKEAGGRIFDLSSTLVFTTAEGPEAIRFPASLLLNGEAVAMLTKGQANVAIKWLLSHPAKPEFAASEAAKAAAKGRNRNSAKPSNGEAVTVASVIGLLAEMGILPKAAQPEPAKPVDPPIFELPKAEAPATPDSPLAALLRNLQSAPASPVVETIVVAEGQTVTGPNGKDYVLHFNGNRCTAKSIG